ncbi:MAG: response regulator [Elusimicrobia bacterium]|nr:response regulator [Elusimicrobiota bacterium]
MPMKLLMIEDDKDVRGLVARTAKRRRWEFHEAGTVQDGLASAAELGPDVILLDVQLPDGEGWDVCAALKKDERLRAIPVLMLSGKRMRPEEKARGLELGADDYLAKPFYTSELCLRI